MCGRFTIKFTIEEVQTRFKVAKILEKFDKNYNVPPFSKIPVIVQDSDDRVLDLYQWNLVPNWAKEAKHGYTMWNTRVESLQDKDKLDPELSFGRCLIPASGFFEWKKIGKEKHPTYFYLKDTEIFAFAGISWHYKNPDGTVLKTCSIITTKPNSMVSKIHDRMPAILPRELESKWLDPDIQDKKEILSIIATYPVEKMAGHQVSQDVNSSRVNKPELIEPIKVE